MERPTTARNLIIYNNEKENVSHDVIITAHVDDDSSDWEMPTGEPQHASQPTTPGELPCQQHTLSHNMRTVSSNELQAQDDVDDFYWCRERPVDYGMMSNNSKMLGDISKDTIEVMRRQESTVYACVDYLQLLRHLARTSEEGNRLADALIARREKICEWVYSVVDFFDVDREAASIVLSYLDRFIATNISENNGTIDARTLELGAITALYIALKLNYHGTLSIQTLVSLTNGRFNRSNIELMEVSMLSQLDWYVHPPTAVQFVHQLAQFFPTEMTDQAVYISMIEQACFYTELAVWDTQICLKTCHPSTVGYAALLNAMESININRLSPGAWKIFVECIAYICPDLVPTSGTVQEAQNRLFDMKLVPVVDPDEELPPPELPKKPREGYQMEDTSSSAHRTPLEDKTSYILNETSPRGFDTRHPPAKRVRVNEF
eukprot:scaffold68080_cov51-Attheya_sp.AAC.4